MPRFFASKRTERKPRNNDEIPDDGLSVERVILAAKTLHFSIDEIRKLTMGEVLTYIDLSLPEKDDKPRKATQADIDRFLC